MNVGELIKELQKYPSETPVCNGENEDIYYTSIQPAYWDGRLERLIHNESLKGKYYSISGYKYTDKGDKVVLRFISLEDVLLDNPDLPVEYSLSNNSIGRYKKIVEDSRKEIKKILQKFDKPE